jgi:hypothetical protein
LARWAERDVVFPPLPQGAALGWVNGCPFGANSRCMPDSLLYVRLTAGVEQWHTGLGTYGSAAPYFLSRSISSAIAARRV